MHTQHATRESGGALLTRRADAPRAATLDYAAPNRDQTLGTPARPVLIYRKPTRDATGLACAR
eukprot:1704548-Pleurochrysis_carterae.AAC.1